MKTGERIRSIRIEKQLTQEALAKEIGRNKSLISEYENDKKTPTMDNLNLIAEALDVNITFLLGEADRNVLSDTQKEWMDICFEIGDEEKIKKMILIVRNVMAYG